MVNSVKQLARLFPGAATEKGERFDSLLPASLRSLERVDVITPYKRKARLRSALKSILRTKPGRTRGRLIAAVLRDVPLEYAKNMVIPNDMLLPIGTFLQSFWVSA